MASPREPSNPRPSEEDRRLAELMEVIVAVAANDVTRRASVGSGEHVLDGIATGLNMLAEEIERQRRVDAEHRAQIAHADRLALVGQLAATIAHEINTPAGFVLGNLTALEQGLERLQALITTLEAVDDRAVSDALAAQQAAATIAEARQLTRENMSGIRRIAEIVREFRAFSRLEPERREVVDMVEVIDEACKLTQRQVAYRARLLRRIAPNVPKVRGLQHRLVQVLTNLIVNAGQAIVEGSPEQNEIEVSLEFSGGSVVARVRDTGSGMDADVRAHLFQPFFTTKRAEQGTGLGLSVSADIVRWHGGELTVQTQLGAGSTFQVRLPPLERPSQSAPREAPVIAAASRRRVLLIDDEQLLLNAYRRMLPREYEVRLACGGRAALEVLERDAAWDTIVCDLMMPDVDGIAVAEWIRTRRPELAERMVFSSGAHGLTPRTEAFAHALGSRLLDKPASREQLIAAIEGRPPRSAP